MAKLKNALNAKNGRKLSIILFSYSIVLCVVGSTPNLLGDRS